MQQHSGASKYIVHDNDTLPTDFRDITEKDHAIFDQQLERCSVTHQKDIWDDPQLEDPVSCWENTRARAKTVQDESVGRTTGATDALTASLKMELLEFIARHNDRWEEALVPDHLKPLLKFWEPL